jgi:hypothetical protein
MFGLEFETQREKEDKIYYEKHRNAVERLRSLSPDEQLKELIISDSHIKYPTNVTYNLYQKIKELEARIEELEK